MGHVGGVVFLRLPSFIEVNAFRLTQSAIKPLCLLQCLSLPFPFFCVCLDFLFLSFFFFATQLA